MSALDQKQTSDCRPLMSALPPKADIAGRLNAGPEDHQLNIQWDPCCPSNVQSRPAIPSSKRSLKPRLLLAPFDPCERSQGHTTGFFLVGSVALKRYQLCSKLPRGSPLPNTIIYFYT